jgi:flavin-dependent dehydrogenase
VKIAIVGAGPAGCHLAHLLGDAEHEVLLFDHRVRPSPEVGYEKPCGGGLSPFVGRRFPEVMALPFTRHRPPRLLLRSSDGSQVEYELTSADWAIVSRAEFGRALLERALGSGRVRHVRQRVTGVARDGEGWSVRTAMGEVFSADYLVGADGVRSLVRRKVVGPIPRQHLCLAVGYLVPGMPDALIFQTFADLEGYAWSFPRPSHASMGEASVGIGSRLGAVPTRDLWARLERFLDEMCPGADRDRRWAALLPMAGDPTLWDALCAGPGWALLGDAAGHVQPLTGEGIAYALWSAELLAKALQQGDPQGYDEFWREAYGRSFAAASAALSRTSSIVGGYELTFQLSMAMALTPLPPSESSGENRIENQDPPALCHRAESG